MIRVARGLGSHLAWSLVAWLPAAGLAATGQVVAAGALAAVALLYTGFMVYFFRDPDRTPPDDPDAVVAGADGWVRSVEDIDLPNPLDCPAVRVSIYLTPWDVHVNRSPVAGTVSRLAYSPGRHLLTRNPRSSEVNEHSTIRIDGEVPCVVRQIVGPVVRRVVAWLEEGQGLSKGERIGMMKFGSRLDVYLPRDRVTVCCKRGDRAVAGESVIATRVRETPS